MHITSATNQHWFEYYDISDLLNYDEENLLEVEVSKMSSNESVNRAERLADYWVFGGIFRPAYLQIKPVQHIQRWAVDANADGSITAELYVEGDGNATSLTGCGKIALPG